MAVETDSIALAYPEDLIVANIFFQVDNELLHISIVYLSFPFYDCRHRVRNTGIADY